MSLYRPTEKFVELNDFPRGAQTEQPQRSSSWIVLLAIALTAAALGKKKAEAEISEISWAELEDIAKLFNIVLPEQDPENLKKAERVCFSAVFHACLQGDWSLVDRLPVEALSKLTDAWGQTLLIVAAGEGNEKLVKFLIERRIALQKTDNEGNTPLHAAVRNGFHRLVPLLGDYYLNDANTQGKASLHLAIEHGHLPVLRALVEKGVSNLPLKEGKYTFSPLALCVRYSQKECLDYLLKQPHHKLDKEFSKLGNLLHVAIHFGQFSMLKTLLNHPEALQLLKKPDNKGRTPLALACFVGDLDAVYLLCRDTKSLQMTSHNGWTLAHWAVAGKQGDILELLARLDADLETPAAGKKPKALLKGDPSPEAKKIKNILSSLIERKRTGKLGPINYQCLPPEGIVFKGGGPRGLAYLEALRALKDKGALDEVQRTAGTSAGAITAAIFALDPKLKDIASLEYLDLEAFLDPIPEKKLLLKGMLKAKDGKDTLSRIYAGTLEMTKETWNPKKFYDAFSGLEGICKGEALREWIEQEVSRRTGKTYCTFGELADLRTNKGFLHLHVYTTRLTDDDHDRVIHFSSEDPTWKDIVISDAIRASMSIPGVYEPYIVREKTSFGSLNPRKDLGPCVDGGLVKNFPIDAFDTPKSGEYYSSFNRRTLGLCLKDVDEEKATPKAEPTQGILNIAKACANLYWQVEEVYLREEKGNQDRTLEISIRGVGLCDFNLTEKQRAELLTAGRQSIENEKFSFSKTRAEPPHFSSIRGGNAISKIAHFTGRKTELRTLEKELIEERQMHQDKTFVRLIYGLGGMGKTELTRAFAADHREEFSIVFFIKSATKEQRYQSYRKLAEKLRIPTYEKEAPEDIQRKVHARLNTDTYEKPWLLIYDNVEEVIREEELPKGGYVLMTSRKRDVWKNDADPIEVTAFTREESEKMLLDITRKTSPKLPELARELGYFPLTLNQAAHYIYEADCSIEEYLTLFRKKPMHGPMSKDQSRYEHTYQTVWQITLETLEKEHPKACEWLKVCAYFNPDDVPHEWLGDWLGEGREDGIGRDKMEIMRILGNLCLLRKRGKECSMHRLLQGVILQSQQNKDASFKHAFDLVKERGDRLGVKVSGYESMDFSYAEKDVPQSFSWEDPLPPKRLDPAGWQHAIKWILQAVHLAQLSSFQSMDLETQRYFLHTISYWNRLLGNYQEAVEYDKKALEVCQGVSEGDFGIIVNEHLGMCLRRLGKHEESLNYYTRALDLKKQILLPDDLRIAESYNNIGVGFSVLGQHLEAWMQHQKAGKVWKETEHKETELEWAEFSAKYLAYLQDLQNQFENKERDVNEVEKYLRERKTMSHLDKPDIIKKYYEETSLVTRIGDVLTYSDGEQKLMAKEYKNLADTLIRLGRPTEALVYYKKQRKQTPTPIVLDSTGGGSDYTLFFYDSLAKSELEKAVELIQHVQDITDILIRTTPFSLVSPLATSFDCMGISLGILGDYQQALNFHKRALSIIQEKLPLAHPQIAINYEYIAINLEALNRFSEALWFRESAFAIYKSTLSPDHPILIHGQYSLGRNYILLGQQEQGIKHVKEALSTSASHPLNQTHELYLASCIDCLNKQSDKVLCEKTKQEILVLYVNKMGEDHPLIKDLKKACQRGWGPFS